VRVPEAVAEARRRQVRRAAGRHCRGLRAQRLELCGWNVLITNAPAELVGLDEAWSLRRLRWQIEMSHPHYASSASLYHGRRAA
jgi:hypothetical protein